MLKRQELTWNVKKISNSLHLSQEEIQRYFKDGRRMSFLLERRIANELMNGKVSDSEGAGYDVENLDDGTLWEVRCLTEDGVYFNPSKDRGSKRQFNLASFKKKLKSVKGFIVGDITKFPNVPIYVVTSKTVLDWYSKKLMDKTSKMTKLRAQKYLPTLPENQPTSASNSSCYLK